MNSHLLGLQNRVPKETQNTSPWSCLVSVKMEEEVWFEPSCMLNVISRAFLAIRWQSCAAASQSFPSPLFLSPAFPSPLLPWLGDRLSLGRGRRFFPSKWRRQLFYFPLRKLHLIPKQRDFWSLDNLVTFWLSNLMILRENCRLESTLRYGNNIFVIILYLLFSIHFHLRISRLKVRKFRVICHRDCTIFIDIVLIPEFRSLKSE